MNHSLIILFSGLLLLGTGCSPGIRSRESFDAVCHKVEGKTAIEVEALLGHPSYRQRSALGDERWLWWNYAFLDGESYPPEVRGQVVHLEITFSDPLRTSGRSLPTSQWRVRQPFGVSYLIPAKK